MSDDTYERDLVYTVQAVDTRSGKGSVELVLCGGCIANGRVMVIERKPNFSHACMWCDRTAPDLRPILKPQCECQPPIYRMELGHRQDKSGEQVPCILLACVHKPCTAHMTVDFDWPKLGKPKFSFIHEGHS
jgi:hypothetical protein